MVSPDTDVFVLCVHLLSTLQHLPGLGMVFELYIKYRRLISVNKCIAGLGEQKAREFLGLHVFSGCDQVEKMATITKARVMKLFMLPLTTHAALESFCNLSLSTEGEQFNTGLSEFTMQLYSSHHDSSVSDIGALRWFLFSKQNYTRDRLPPTWGALKYHILRANFVACMWHLSVMSFNPVIPSPADSGWVLSEGKLSAHMTDNLPALASYDRDVCLQM